MTNDPKISYRTFSTDTRTVCVISGHNAWESVVAVNWSDVVAEGTATMEPFYDIAEYNNPPVSFARPKREIIEKKQNKFRRYNPGRQRRGQSPTRRTNPRPRTARPP